MELLSDCLIQVAQKIHVKINVINMPFHFTFDDLIAPALGQNLRRHPGTRGGVLPQNTYTGMCRPTGS